MMGCRPTQLSFKGVKQSMDDQFLPPSFLSNQGVGTNHMKQLRPCPGQAQEKKTKGGKHSLPEMVLGGSSQSCS